MPGELHGTGGGSALGATAAPERWAPVRRRPV